MNTTKSIIAAMIISLPLTVLAEGGSLWEKKAQAKAEMIQQNMHYKTSAAKKMGHTASQHKYWATEDSKVSTEEQFGESHTHQKPHTDHMGVDHKRMTVGS